MRLRNNKKVYKEMKKGIFLWVLSGCLLLAGCQNETLAELAGWQNETVAEEDVLEKEVTVISVLDKAELAIANERFCSDDSNSMYLDNRFTPEEIDTILSTIEGTWIVDEYVGFVPYESGAWRKGTGTVEELREQYEKAVKQAKQKLPEICLRVKSDSGKEPEGSNHYIYMQTADKSYKSPMSIAISMQEEKTAYAWRTNRTTEGSGIPRDSGYPVIYIEFFAASESGEGESSYEPAALVLASDGNFLFLKDGAFYSLKSSIQSRIMGGDFECLDNDREYAQSIEKTYDWIRNGLKDGQWRRVDLNGDGIEDLILEEKETVAADLEEKRIIGIFACYEDEARCILWDVNDGTEYYFCGATGELMYFASSYGGVVSAEPYSHYYFDEEWNKITDYTLVVYRIDSKMDEEYAEKWKKENPDMAEDGVYYRKFTEEGIEILTREELESIYEMETGYEFYSEF